MAPPPSASSASSQVPYIGSTISLLSKAGIRYEGFLHSIDQKEASVTLDHVRVFGTEDRQCERRVPPSPDTFEYIIFRAADITELRVIDTPLSRPVPDPAIIRVQAKPSGSSSAANSGNVEESNGGRSAGGGSGRRRHAKGTSAGRVGGAGGRPGRSQINHQHHYLLPPPSKMQLPAHSPQPSRPRNDWYSWYSVSYRGNQGAGGSGMNGGVGGVGGYYPQYRPASMYQAADFAAAASNGYPMRPHHSGGGGSVGVNGNGGRPVMQFSRYQGNGQRRLSPRLVVGSGGIGGGGAGIGGSRGGRHLRRSHQPNGIAEAAAHPAKYFSADYDFETANAEMAKLLLTAVKKSSAANGIDAGQLVNGSGGGSSSEDNAANEDASDSAAAAAASASSSAAANRHCGYDKERSFYDDISRVDVDPSTAAGGDSARLGRKEAARQNALNRETFGLSGRRFHPNHQHHRGAPLSSRRSPV